MKSYLLIFLLVEGKDGLKRKMIRRENSVWNTILDILLIYCLHDAFHLQRIAAEPDVVNATHNAIHLETTR